MDTFDAIETSDSSVRVFYLQINPEVNALLSFFFFSVVFCSQPSWRSRSIFIVVIFFYIFFRFFILCWHKNLSDESGRCLRFLKKKKKKEKDLVSGVCLIFQSLMDTQLHLVCGLCSNQCPKCVVSLCNPGKILQFREWESYLCIDLPLGMSQYTQ